MGEVVDKVGAVSGWTYGTIDQGCVDISLTSPYGGSFYFICQERAGMLNRYGDSGSAVIIYDPNTGNATLAGQAFAGNPGCDTCTGTLVWFSPLNNINWDYGDLVATVYGT